MLTKIWHSLLCDRFMSKSRLREKWDRVAPTVVIGVPSSVALGFLGSQIPGLREAYQVANETGAGGIPQWIMAGAAITAVPAGIIGVTEILRIRRNELEEAIERRKAEQAAEEQRREDTLEDQRIERHENTLRLRQNYAQLGARRDALEQWYASERRKIREMKLQYPDAKEIIEQQAAETDATYYTLLLSIFEQGYIDFYEPDNREYDEYWDAIEGDIRQKLAERTFFAQLPDLLTDDTNDDFRRYMEDKISKLSAANAGLGIDSPPPQNGVPAGVTLQ